MRLAAVIPAAGSSTRMGDSGKKEFLVLNKKPVIQHSLDAFIQSGIISRIVIICRPEDRELLQSIFRENIIPVDIDIANGGKTRQESVLNGLKALEPYKPDGVFIHDGARPWLTPQLINKLAEILKQGKAVIPTEPSTIAMKIIDETDRIVHHLERSLTVGAQTPQVFPFDAILQAHKQAAFEKNNAFIDDASLFSHYGREVYTIPGPPENRKITYSHDLDL